MRIISGFLKGKKLDFLKSTTTRPLRDFVKEKEGALKLLTLSPITSSKSIFALPVSSINCFLLNLYDN